MGTQALCAVLLLAHSAAAAVRLGGMACGPARFHATALALALGAIVATALAARGGRRSDPLMLVPHELARAGVCSA